MGTEVRQGTMNVITKVRLSRATGVLVTALILALTPLLLPTTALAQEPDGRQPVVLTVAAPADVPLGNLARIIAVLRDGAGKPIAGARLVFTSPAAFIGAVGEMTIAEAVTDVEGVATLDYQLRIQGQNQVMVRFLGDRTYQPAEASTVVLATGQAQLAQRTAGVEMPVLGSWALIAVLGAVWSVYLAALLLVAGIPREGTRPSDLERGGT